MCLPYSTPPIRNRNLKGKSCFKGRKQDVAIGATTGFYRHSLTPGIFLFEYKQSPSSEIPL